MTFEELVETIKQDRFIVAVGESKTLEYQGLGFNGQTSILDKGAWITSYCFSPICKNECDMVVRPRDRKQKLNKREWVFLKKFLQEVNPSIRKMIKEYPPTYMPCVMRFNCGHGYLNYLVFSLWRSIVLSPKAVVFLQFFSEMGYTPQESYILLRECSLLWVSLSPWERLLGSTLRIKPGVVKRLVNIKRYIVRSPYSMDFDVVKRKTFSGTTSEPFVAIGGFFKGSPTARWSLQKENFTKETLDSVLEYYKEGRVQE